MLRASEFKTLAPEEFLTDMTIGMLCSLFKDWYKLEEREDLPEVRILDCIYLNNLCRNEGEQGEFHRIYASQLVEGALAEHLDNKSIFSFDHLVVPCQVEDPNDEGPVDDEGNPISDR